MDVMNTNANTSGKKQKQNAPLELAPLCVRLIWNGALKDGAKEQQTTRAVIQLLVVHVMILQHVVHHLRFFYKSVQEE
jgi:hypothetical protein